MISHPEASIIFQDDYFPGKLLLSPCQGWLAKMPASDTCEKCGVGGDSPWDILALPWSVDTVCAF
jgi:hypothetical protein